MCAMFFTKKDRNIAGGSRIEHLREQVQKNPGSFHLRIKLAEAYILGGEKSKGIDLLMNMASKDAREGSIDKAIAVYKLVLRYDADNVEAKDILATIYRCKGLAAEAEALGEKEVHSGAAADDLDSLSRISTDDLRQFSEVFPIQEVDAGVVIVRQGEVGDTFYLIVSGEVVVYRQDGEQREHEITCLEAGSFFGEMSTLEKGPRMASVKAVSNCRLVVIARHQLEMIKQRYPRLHRIIVQGYQYRLIDLILTSLVFFHRFPARRRAEIITRLQSVSVLKGEQIIQEGKHNDVFYIILAGKVAVTMHVGEKIVALATLGKGDFFGEISMITGRPAIATVTADTGCLLAAMDKQLLDEIATQFPHFLRNIMEHLKRRNQETMSRMIESYQN